MKVINMKLIDILEESLFDRIKAALGTVKGKIVSSVKNLIDIFKKDSSAKLLTIGIFDVPELGLSKVPTRVDTGASTCSIHATDVKVEDKKVSFKTSDGKEHTLSFLKMGTIKNANGVKEVPKVKISFKWNDKTYSNIETKLSDRSKLKFKLLVGRNLIKELKVPVNIDPSDDFGDNDDKK